MNGVYGYVFVQLSALSFKPFASNLEPFALDLEPRAV